VLLQSCLAPKCFAAKWGTIGTLLGLTLEASDVLCLSPTYSRYYVDADHPSPSPRTKCFPDNLSHQLLYENTPFVQTYTVPVTGNLSDPSNHVSLTEQSRQFLAVAEARANLCSENMDVEDLRYMGTATVVRDMELMTRVFDGDGAKMYAQDLCDRGIRTQVHFSNYLGGSYGSVLGAYLVNMCVRQSMVMYR
jgi:hypothetical protein